MTTPPMTRHELAKMIDHSLLRQDVTRQDTIAGCELAMKYDVASATVKSCYVKLAADILKGSDVKVNPVIDFPNGYATTEDKVFETKRSIDDGAQEIDIVMNLGAFLSGDYDFVRDDIAAVVKASQGAPVKVIFEVYFLKERDDLLVKACQLAEEAGVTFVKTSTGFAPEGYTMHQLELMRASVSPKVQVKAAQGVRSLDDAIAVHAIGVTRFGARSTEKIMQGWDERFGGK